MNRKGPGEGNTVDEKARLFDSAIVGTAQEAVDFITNIPESSTEYSVIAKDLTGKIVLWNEGAHRLYGYGPDEVVRRIPRSCTHARMSRLAYASKSCGQHSKQANGKELLPPQRKMASSSPRVS